MQPQENTFATATTKTGGLPTSTARTGLPTRMVTTRWERRNKRQRQRQRADDDADAGQRFSTAFAAVPVPSDILLRRSAEDEDDEVKKRASRHRVERNATGDCVGHAGDPLIVVNRDNRRNLDNLSGAGRAAYITRLDAMLQESEFSNFRDKVNKDSDSQHREKGEKDSDDSEEEDNEAVFAMPLNQPH